MSDSNNVININNEINWTKVVKKEARGIDDADFGEVQEIVLHYIFTEKGLVNKEKFYLPTDLVAGFDGEKLRFNISEEEAKEKFQRETSPSADEYAIYKRKIISTDIDTDKHHNNENIAGLNPDIYPSKEVKDANQVKQETHNNTEGLPSQNKKFNIKSKVEDREAEERSSREAEDKAKQEAERRAQSIQDKAKQEAERKAQSIQDKAKQEAERKAQSIAQQAEDKAKQEAERRAQSIAQQAEDKAKQEADRRFREIIQQAEDKAKQEADRRFREIIQQAEDKAKQEAERRAQSIAQQAEDKAKQEAERRAQSIAQQAEDKAKQEDEVREKIEADERFNAISEEVEQKVRKEAADTAQLIAQQAEDKAKHEADRRFREIIQQAEDKAKHEADRRFREIIQQAEDKAKHEDEVKKELSQEKSRYFETNDINENNAFFNPFMIGINTWQNYSLLCMNITKEMLSNTRRMTKDFENTIRRIRQNTAV